MTALAQYIADARERPFEWSMNNCALFAAGGADLQCETDYVRYIKEQYPCETAADYARLMRDGGLYELTVGVLGQPSPMAELEEGDVVLVGSARAALGLWVPPIAIAPGSSGLEAFGRDEILSCWSLRACRKH